MNIIRKVWNWLLRRLCEASYRAKIVTIIVIQGFATFAVTYGSYTSTKLSLLLPSLLTDYSKYILNIIISIIFDLIGILGMILLNYELLRFNCKLFLDRSSAIFTLIYSSILTGISMAFFVAYLTYFFSMVSPLDPIGVSSLIKLKILVSLLVMMFLTSSVPTFYQIFFVVFFHEREVSIIGGNLILTAIGILAMSMGMALSTLQLPQSTVNFSTIAGPIVGSGLTLIATGLQRYYEDQRAHVKCA